MNSAGNEGVEAKASRELVEEPRAGQRAAQREVHGEQAEVERRFLLGVDDGEKDVVEAHGENECVDDGVENHLPCSHGRDCRLVAETGRGVHACLDFLRVADLQNDLEPSLCREKNRPRGIRAADLVDAGRHRAVFRDQHAVAEEAIGGGDVLQIESQGLRGRLRQLHEKAIGSGAGSREAVAHVVPGCRNANDPGRAAACREPVAEVPRVEEPSPVQLPFARQIDCLPQIRVAHLDRAGLKRGCVSGSVSRGRCHEHDKGSHGARHPDDGRHAPNYSGTLNAQQAAGRNDPRCPAEPGGGSSTMVPPSSGPRCCAPAGTAPPPPSWGCPSGRPRRSP